MSIRSIFLVAFFSLAAGCNPSSTPAQSDQRDGNSPREAVAAKKGSEHSGAFDLDAVRRTQDARFLPFFLAKAREELVPLLAAKRQLAITPFPIVFSVVSKLENGKYEIRNRTTGRHAVLLTSETEFRTTGFGNLMVLQEKPIVVTLKNGFESKVQVFVESPNAKESDYYELLAAVKKHEALFRRCLRASNVSSPNSKEDFASMLNLNIEDIALVWRGTWKKLYESDKLVDADFVLPDVVDDMSVEGASQQKLAIDIHRIEAAMRAYEEESDVVIRFAKKLVTLKARVSSAVAMLMPFEEDIDLGDGRVFDFKAGGKVRSSRYLVVDGKRVFLTGVGKVQTVLEALQALYELRNNK